MIVWLSFIFFNCVYGFWVCGNYCGPDYCNGEYISESKCDEHVQPESWKHTGPSCADSCCQIHDRCCRGDTNMTNCNREIVKCLRECNPFSLTCTRDGVPFISGLIEVAMNIVEDWCCGEPCQYG